jgi:hypothetical protein
MNHIDWNKKYPVGTKVRYTPMDTHGRKLPVVKTVTRTQAYTEGRGQFFVGIKATRELVPLSFVTPMEEADAQ